MSQRSTRHRGPSSQGEACPFAGLRPVNPHAAGVDIGAHEMMACVLVGDDQQLVRAFGTYTAELDALAGLVHRPRPPDGRHGIHRGIVDSTA